MLPDVKWTLTFGDLVAAMVPLVAFLGGMYLKQYFWNSEKFNNEYTELEHLLEKLAGEVGQYTGNTPADPQFQTSIMFLIKNNPMKFERGLKSDWDKLSTQINQLSLLSEPQMRNEDQAYDQHRFIRKRGEVMEKLIWFRDKLKNYYRCHSFGRWKYRLTAIPAIVKGWLE